jgi:hypothetical protein
MPTIRTPRGITPPAPGLEREEPTFVPEQDIPAPEARGAARSDAAREEHPARGNDRE